MRGLGWGLHRLGQITAAAPWLALVFMLLMSAVALYGTTKIESGSHSLDKLFEADTPEYRLYAQTRAAFPLNERDIILLVSAKSPFTSKDVETLRELHLELQLLDPVESVLSIFSLRETPDATGYAAPIIPDELPQGAAFQAMMASVAAHPFASGKLINRTPAGGEVLVFVLGMKADAVNQANLVPTIDRVDRSAHSALTASGLNYEMFGVPFMQREVRLASRADRLTFNIVGFLVGLIVALAFFRNVKLVVITTLCPVVANLWALGVYGLLGLPLSFFTNAIPPLVLVISFAEATHLAYGIRRHLRQGDTIKKAVTDTIAVVGPGCVLTTLTTSAAFLSLVFTDSEPVREFGYAGAIAIVCVFIASMTLVPAVAMLLLRESDAQTKAPFVGWMTDAALDRAAVRLGEWAPRYPIQVALFGAILCVVCGALYFQLEPQFRLSEQVPTRLRQQIERTESYAGLAASSPLYVVVHYPSQEPFASDRLLHVLGEVDDTLSRQQTIGNVWSLALVERQLAGSGLDVTKYLEDLPEQIRARLVNEEAHALLVAGYLPDLEAKEMRRVIEVVESGLRPIRAANPDLSIEITGIAAVAAVDATSMIEALNSNLALEIFVVMALLALAFRSWTVPLLAVIPNIFPIAASGALLYAFRPGIDYAGIIGLSIAFGLACDDTIHFISRYQYERKQGRDVTSAVVATVDHMFAVMVITTFVIMLGVSVTLLGQMPQTRLFGAVVVVTLFSALAAELLLTPALILAPHAVGRLWRSLRAAG